MQIYLIHHAHTDIGYTDRQEKIEWNHVKYIEDVLNILRESEKTPDWDGFVWNVETFWMVDAFLKYGKEADIADFWRYVKAGKIGLSGSYHNGTDILSAPILKEKLAHAQEVAAKQGFAIESAMSADINGYPWGYATALHDAGVKHLLSFVHTHHGYHVCNKKQFPFYWIGPDGSKLLVWQGEHYHVGDEFAIQQIGDPFSYMIRDGLPEQGVSGWELSVKRIFAYVKKLKEDGYPFDFCPIGISGLRTDNSPPGPRIIEFVHRWNAEFGNEISLKMATLDEFFAEVEKHPEQIPSYSGDWTDWWADGVFSTPNVVKHYREAARKYQICKNLDPKGEIVDPALLASARDDLMLYAEHTWGFSSCVVEPCHPQVNTLDMRKTLYAARAHEAVSIAVDRITEHFGETAVITWKDYRIQVLNPTPHPMSTIARTDLEILFTHKYFRLIDESTGDVVPCQLTHVPRGWEFNIPVTLGAYEKKSFILEEIAPPEPTSAGMFATAGAECVADFAFDTYGDPDWICTPYDLVTPYFAIHYEVGKGITSIFDRIHHREMIREGGASAFQPIHEITHPTVNTPHQERREMGRNRKTVHTLRDFGRLTDVTVGECGDVQLQVTLHYEVSGSTSTELILTAYRNVARIDVDYRLHKENNLDPENVYLALPFGAEDAVLYADKTGCVFRPRIDQLPGSCCEFYALQNAAAWIFNDHAVMVEMPDAPMIWMAPLEAHPIHLMGDPELKNTDPVYSWVMNNFWETNFKAGLGGFHQYRYVLRLVDSTDANACMALAEAENTGVLTFPSFDLPLEK